MWMAGETLWKITFHKKQCRNLVRLIKAPSRESPYSLNYFIFIPDIHTRMYSPGLAVIVRNIYCNYS